MYMVVMDGSPALLSSEALSGLKTKCTTFYNFSKQRRKRLQSSFAYRLTFRFEGALIEAAGGRETDGDPGLMILA